MDAAEMISNRQQRIREAMERQKPTLKQRAAGYLVAGSLYALLFSGVLWAAAMFLGAIGVFMLAVRWVLGA